MTGTSPRQSTGLQLGDDLSRRLPPYDSYAPAVLDGVARLPSHWELKPLKRVVQINPEELPQTTDPDYELTYVDIGNVTLTDGIVSTEEYRFEAAPSRARRRVSDGDTIISTVRTYLKAVARIVNPASNLIVSTGFAVLRPRPELDPGFLFRLVQCEEFVGRVVSHSTGVSYPAIAPTTLAQFCVWIPPLDEQRAIAAFLDRETAKIDALVEKKRRLIELLREKRAALIGHAVTKGLNPDAPMKPSGIDWLGDVPEHWGLRKLGHVVEMRGGSTPNKSNEEYWSGDIPWVSPKDMKCFEVVDSEDHVADIALRNTSLQLFQPPVVLMVVRGMILAHTFPVAITSAPVTINQDMKALRPRPGYLHRYVAYLLNGISRVILGKVEESAHGTKVLRTDLWRNTEVYVPGTEEQQALCEQIDRVRQQYGSLIGKVESALARLCEYRTALISAAVTGKIDVRKPKLGA